MKGLKKFMAFLALPAMLLAAAACNSKTPDGGNGDGTGNGGDGQGGYKDVIERPDIDIPAVPPQAVYPEKPAAKPSAAPGVRPSIASYTAYEAESTYKITEENDVVHVSYHDVTNFAYVYAEVENYSSEYSNVKITIENSGAERIAIQAVYYEQYELGYLPVTVYMSELTAGEQYAIFEMRESMILDDTFTTVQGQSVKDKTVLGFVIFIDSLPSYKPEDDASGELDIVNFEFLPDGDPALEDRYVKPVADLSAATADTGVTLTPSEEKLTASGNGSVYIPVEKYSVDYAKFNVELNGAADTAVDIAVQYTLPGATKAISTAKSVTLTGADEIFEYNYEEMSPTSGGDDLTTQYIKNGTVTAVVITPVDGDEIEILGVTFLRTAKEGAYVSDSWMSASSDVTIPRSANGGNAKLEIGYNESWNNITVGVKNGANVTGIRYTIYAPDGLVHLGIGLVNNSSLKTDGQNAGHFILRGSAALFNGNNSVAATMDAILNGVTETIAYDETSKIYTITYDFSGMAENKLEDYTITSLIFYPHCPDPCTNKNAHKYDGTHNLYFLSIDLITE